MFNGGLCSKEGSRGLLSNDCNVDVLPFIVEYFQSMNKDVRHNHQT